MADGCYELVGLVPASSDFSLERAVQFFSEQTFTRYKTPVRADLLFAKTDSCPTGFRVCYGAWGITAWLDSSPAVAIDNRYLAEETELPAPPEVIAACP